LLLESRRINVYADYHQFYIQDAQHPGNTGDPAFWTKEALANKLAVIRGTIGIGTASYGFVDVVVEIHDAPPNLDSAEWDHVTEADLDVASGRIMVVGCLDSLEDPVEAFDVQPGYHRVRCCYANLAAGSEGTGDQPGGDWYRVQAWLASPTAPSVLKRSPTPPENA
jgi:hypothetical protein